MTRVGERDKLHSPRWARAHLPEWKWTIQSVYEWNVQAPTTPISDVSTGACQSQDVEFCKDLLSRYNQKIICSDKLISKICPLTCNASVTMQSSMTSTDMPTSGGSTSDGTNTISSWMTPITPITYLVNSTRNGSSNNTSGIQTTYNNKSHTTSTTSLPMKTHPHCIGLNPNCPYLQKSVNICSNAEVALRIGCHLTCGYRSK
ncbi:unnamed protein product [Mytilus coruscus]|uniref:Uncharacterized protein n=1 Tax=Mytilus coruscus TaxID=42192 RepID=A0A6J8CC82_MYTCO|nr:unnamed protein product [Mytilus coruscus]